ncbi:ATP-binding protein [Paracrocinitomix mangrovi]|uniref:sensor histidine kinase n=1 Tax=Paracrocinitomix mangrovi TaxID=2862509 RepID=UPI001C8EB8D6|nr:ATP-binding protein [Paracrocinitomix mangrovi]UKN00629.1 ATP-binding protein [Paracrocinitomix mangrovi]
MKSTARKRFILGASIGFLLWIIGAFLHHFQLVTGLDESVVADFQDNYLETCEELTDITQEFIDKTEKVKSTKDKFEKAIEIASDTDFEFYLYRHDSLILWTNNNPVIPERADGSFYQEEVLYLDNGYYQSHAVEKDSFRYISLFKIKNEYRYENEDLSNNFSKELDEDFPANLTFQETKYPVLGVDGEVAFYVADKEDVSPNENTELLIFFAYLCAFIILLQLLINAFQKLLIKKPFLLIVFPIIVVGLRYLWLTLGWEGFMNNFELFNPELFASSQFVPSLGDLIINVAIFYFLVHFLLKRTRNWFKQGNKKLKLVFFVVPLFLMSFYAAFKINDIIYSLVYDSKMSFDLERLFDFSLYSFLGLAIIGASFYAYFKLLQYIIIQLKKNEFEWNRLAFLWTLSSATYVTIDLIYFDHSFLTSLWPVILSGFLLWFEFKEKEYKFVHVISIVAFISFYAAYILQGYSDNNEREIRMAEAQMIAEDNDLFAEFEYDDIEKDMSRDHFLLPYFTTDFDQSEFSEYLETSYFNGLKNDYDLTFYLFNSNRKMIVDLGNYEIRDYDRFEEIITVSGQQSSINRNIYFIKDYTDKLTYIAKYPVYGEQDDTLYGYMLTEMRSKKFPEDIGLPSLLLDGGAHAYHRLKEYSVAKYVDNKLVTRKGEYAYPTIGNDWNKKNAFINMDGYNHYVYQEVDGFTTVISKKIKTKLYLFTSFSYLLIMYGVLLLIPLGYQQLRAGISFKSIKLNVKIQVVLIGLILTTLIAFAIGAGTFVEEQYKQSNEGFIKEKLGSVKTELENKFYPESELRSDLAVYLQYLLIKKFSKVFAVDINVYNTSGELLGSSQPKIYSNGLISRKMNAQAFWEVHWDKKSEYVHEEHIGNLNYLSAYAPFFNQKGEFLAYVNVQYISRQDELEDQISGFLLAIMNIMVLMLAISTILTITISNRLTRPLKYIQESLRHVQLGSKYKPIEYDGSDEVGELVKEYNLKVEELQQSVEALAKSERESAWREMAKQVAHEIKNPLTPMKLSIQHLKRIVNVADEESAEKLDRVSKSLIEQIDALTKIANEFSNFAKMPKPNEAELNLVEIVQNAVAVFNQDDDYTVELDIQSGKEAMIWADKDLLLRVFNNLIKNASQAIPQEVEGRIKVKIIAEENEFIVSVEDNGVGIDDEARDSIFVPYFTTKSKGTGLGLAMTKQIIESMSGGIWFESKVGVGTTFYVSFPVYNR